MDLHEDILWYIFNNYQNDYSVSWFVGKKLINLQTQEALLKSDT